MPWNPIRRRRRTGPGGRTTRHPPDGLLPADAEARLAEEPNEWMYVYAPAGRRRGRFEGTPDNVDLSADFMRFTDDAPPRSVLRDHLVVHNHPPTLGPHAVASYPPSPRDLALMVDRDLREFVVVSGRYRYAVGRPGEHWIGDEGLYRDELDAIRATLAVEIGPAAPTAAGAAARQHLILERLRARGWIDYERTAR